MIYHIIILLISKIDSSISAEKKYNYNLYESRSNRRRLTVLYKRSGNMPGWAANPEDFWKAAYENERGKGLFYYNINAPLPMELNFKQQLALVEAFVEAVIGDYVLPHTYIIKVNGTSRLRLMLSPRINDNIPRDARLFFKRANPTHPEKGGARKAPIGSCRGRWLKEIIQLWETLINEALKKTKVS